jgi:hypothetical protein
MRAPGQYAWRLAPRLGAAIGAWGGSAQFRGPPALTSRSSWASARRRSRCRNATLAAGRADRERDRLASPTSRDPFQTFVKPVRRDAAAAAAQRLADLRALRDDQRAKEAEVAAQEAEHRQRPMPTDGLPHACGGRLSGCGPASAVCCTLVVARMLLGRWQVGAKAECGGRCLGGGRLGAEAACGKAALGCCRWGQRQHKSIGMPLFDQDQARTHPAAAHNPAAAH